MKKSNKFVNLLKLINEFEDWKQKNNVENVFKEFEDKYYEIIINQEKILKELKELRNKPKQI